MTSLESNLRRALREAGVGAETGVLVGVSGGADSTALLDALVRVGGVGRIVAAHLNHQLRGEESDGDETFVRALAGRLGVEAVCERADVAGQGGNLEAAARSARYGFFTRQAEGLGLDAVLTAHTRDDQAETVLMRLLRGSGAQGLRGIRAERPLGGRVRLLRPLLGTSRDEVLAHCAARALAYRTDSSNHSLDLTRNRIRWEVLPMLRGVNPRAGEALARIAEQGADEDAFLARIADEALAAARDGDALAVDALAPLDPVILRRVFRRWLALASDGAARLDAVHVAALERFLRAGQSGRVLQLPGQWRVLREFDRLRCLRAAAAPPPPEAPLALSQNCTADFGAFSFELLRRLPRRNVPPNLALPYAVLRESTELDALQVRARIAGDAYVPTGARQQIKLKTLLIRHKIPLSRRHSYPILVTARNQIVWAPGLPVARAFAVQDPDPECALVIAHNRGTD